MGTPTGEGDSLIRDLAALDAAQDDTYEVEQAAIAARLAAVDTEFSLDGMEPPRPFVTIERAAHVGRAAVERATAFPRATGADQLRNSAFGKSPFKL